jgi:ribosomal protein S18 acetylase RimI-like enzyme
LRAPPAVAVADHGEAPEPAFIMRDMDTLSEPQLRTAEPADIDAIVALVESAYRGDSGRRGWTTESDLLDGHRTDAAAVADTLRHADSCILLAERDRHLVASCHLQRLGEAAYFGMFAVDPAEQGNGLGKWMLANAERTAGERWHSHAMLMTVIEQRPELIAWYTRRGYRPTGEHQPFPYGDERFGIPRRDDLRFVVLAKALSGVAA